MAEYASDMKPYRVHTKNRLAVKEQMGMEFAFAGSML